MTLDRLGLRILGVLLEKQLATPEHYPLTENALLAGCNQKSNRDPTMELELERLRSGVLELQQGGWIGRTERDGGRTSRFSHRVSERLGLDSQAQAILAELLVRGPQAPGALLRRIARMGVVLPDAGAVEAVLRALRDRGAEPLVAQLPRQARERDARWAHRLGPDGGAEAAEGSAADGSTAPKTQTESPPGEALTRADLGEPLGGNSEVGSPSPQVAGLVQRIEELESRLDEMKDLVERLRDRLDQLTS